MNGERKPQDHDVQQDHAELDVDQSRHAEHDAEYRCDLCGAPMKEWHCRIICNHCGYQRDCSDP
jgi:hypothetical protein